MHIIDCAVQIKFCTAIDRCPHAIFSSANTQMYKVTENRTEHIKTAFCFEVKFNSILHSIFAKYTDPLPSIIGGVGKERVWGHGCDKSILEECEIASSRALAPKLSCILIIQNKPRIRFVLQLNSLQQQTNFWMPMKLPIDQVEQQHAW